MEQQETAGDEFFRPVKRAPTFDPAGQYRRSMAGQTEAPEAARKRRRRRRRTLTRITTLGLLVVLGVGGYLAYPTVSTKVLTFVREDLVQEIDDVAAGEQNFHALYGGFTTDRSQLTVAKDGFNDVRIVSADGRNFCLAGDPLVGEKVYYTPSTGLSEKPCV
ncbi:hypothetical protein OG218_24960 [Kineococcus sp. NBC_00420]|uniref:hypothetical protein n=1 Tax=Kineococcus sp. NBC_00420 TaxID=2903564 RepID=UPI002E1B01B8